MTRGRGLLWRCLHGDLADWTAAVVILVAVAAALAAGSSLCC